jgi:transposase InsO family protein
MADRSRDVSDELTEVRTVLSRAETALARLDMLDKRRGEVRRRWVTDPPHHSRWEEYVYEPDQDLDDMRVSLMDVINILKRWRKHGSTGSTRHRRWLTGS